MHVVPTMSTMPTHYTRDTKHSTEYRCNTAKTLDALYIILVCALGLSLLGCLIYSVVDHKDTISNAMINNITYRIAISTCIVLHMCFWITCLHSKRWIDENAAAWGMVALGLATFSWIGLTTILEGDTHIAFVAGFVTAFMILLLVLCRLTWQRLASDILILSVATLLVCIVAMIILFNTGKFYIMEHVGFIAYSAIFTAFFLVHRPDEWGADPELLIQQPHFHQGYYYYY